MGIARASSNLVRVDPSASAQYAPCWIRPALIFFFFFAEHHENNTFSLPVVATLIPRARHGGGGVRF
jgi:hypothetical protein